MKNHVVLLFVVLIGAFALAQTPPAQAPPEPIHIPFHATSRILWGDEASGRVADSRYYSGSKIMFQIYGMEPGQVFRHSDVFTTLFQVDGIYYVLSGILVLNNPGTGETVMVKPGELAFLARHNWNHGFAYGTEPLRVLEYLPRHAGGGALTPASERPPLTPKYTQDQLLGRWPAALDEARRGATHRVVRDPDILWRLEGKKSQILVGIMASTDQITFGKIILQPGQESEVRVHGGDLGVYLEQGELQVRLPKSVLDQRGQTRWFDVKQADGVYVPEGTPYHYYNPSGNKVATLIFGVAPTYLPSAAKPSGK